MIKNILFLIIQISLYTPATSRSQYYDVPSYYGHFSLQYFEMDELRTGQLVLLEYHFVLDASYSNQTIFFAKEKEHCIYKYDTKTSKSEIFLGKCGTSGNLIGSKDNALFNRISSIAYFQTPSKQLVTRIKNQRVVLVKNQSCEMDDTSCLIQTDANLLNITNIRIANKVSLFEDEESERFLIIADTNNHCIKRYSFEDELIQIIAGKCGESGFADGPLGYNMLSYPKNLGISRQGVIYFFDSDNQYIRIIKQGNVHTLLLGACKQFYEARTIADVTLKQILCYENWIQMSKSQTHHYFDPFILNICTQQYSKC